MSFENTVGQTESEKVDDGRPDGGSIWGMKHMREKVKDFVDGIKEKSPREAVRNITEAADQATKQAKNYVKNTTVRGLVDDVTGIIRRYPVQSLMVGLAFGLLLSRRRED
jgi:hypothetical protein